LGGTNPAQSLLLGGSDSDPSRVVSDSGTVLVLVMKTRHRTVGWFIVPLEAQPIPLSGWVGSQLAWIARVQIWSTAAMLAPGGGVAEATVAIDGAESGAETEPTIPFRGVATAETACVTVVGGVTPVVWHT
jgi:hypothetical protein